jgi:glycosyltransferase involved in cell wall biosynthesis
MMLVRNEEHRWLDLVLQQMLQICDRVVVLDDDSTDNTAQICMDYGCEVYTSQSSRWGVNEREARMDLFEKTITKVEHGEWILCLDADELFVNSHIPYIEYLFNSLSNDINGIAFRLYDMWSETHYREDQHWQAHRYYWPMAIRYHNQFPYHWLDKKLHCGRFPANASAKCLPTMIPIKHMGWSREEDRLKKYARYMECDPEGKEGILAQYLSIIDKSPNLVKFHV